MCTIFVLQSHGVSVSSNCLKILDGTSHMKKSIDCFFSSWCISRRFSSVSHRTSPSISCVLLPSPRRGWVPSLIQHSSVCTACSTARDRLWLAFCAASQRGGEASVASSLPPLQVSLLTLWTTTTSMCWMPATTEFSQTSLTTYSSFGPQDGRTLGAGTPPPGLLWFVDGYLSMRGQSCP